MSIIWLVVKTLGSLFVVACGLRLYLQFVRLHPDNPLSRLVFQLTDWLVLPIRRLFPPTIGFDWPSLIAGLALSLGLVVIFYFLTSAQMITSGDAQWRGSPVRPLGWLFVLACIWFAQWCVQLAVVLLIAGVVLSWFSPMHPLKPVLDRLVDPMLAPFRRLLFRGRPGPRSGLDLSPIGGFLMLQIASALLASAEAPVMRHLF